MAGEFARAYNRRKERMNAFWGEFHATVVEEGDYLWRCLCYIELNMVRCGKVAHPQDWEWLGYPEIMGQRQRYRLMDLERLCWRLRTESVPELGKNLEAALLLCSGDRKQNSRIVIKWKDCHAPELLQSFLHRLRVNPLQRTVRWKCPLKSQPAGFHG